MLRRRRAQFATSLRHPSFSSRANHTRKSSICGRSPLSRSLSSRCVSLSKPYSSVGNADSFQAGMCILVDSTIVQITYAIPMTSIVIGYAKYAQSTRTYITQVCVVPGWRSGEVLRTWFVMLLATFSKVVVRLVEFQSASIIAGPFMSGKAMTEKFCVFDSALTPLKVMRDSVKV